jgi:hypothetical protein
VKHIVKSSDGVEFVVESYPNSVAFDQVWAATLPAEQLKAHGDFVELTDLSQLAPSYCDTPRICGPLERRAALRLIPGGKP